MKLENNEICRIVDGDEIAFNRFMEHYSSRLYHYTFALLGQKESAEEIVSDVFFEVWKNRKSLAEIGNMNAWIQTITYRKAISFLRKETGKYELSFDDTIKKIIYEEGVYPTHGTRPIFSTVHEIVKSRFPNIIRYICENNLKDRVYKIQYTFNDETNLIVINLYDIYGFAISNIKFEIKLRLKKLRDSDINDEEQALCALHESGHFVMYAKLFNKLPEKLVSRTTDTNTGGFMMEDIDNSKRKISKKDMLNEIQVLLGGYVAEKVVFGEQMTSGASNDLYRATQLASRLVRRFGMGNSTIVTTNTDAPDDNFGFLLNEDNQNYINKEIRDIIEQSELEVFHTLQTEEWKKMLKESAIYLCENSAMPKDKMKEIYDKVSDTVKITARNEKFYHDAILNM